VWGCAFEFPKWAPTIANAELISGEWDQEGCVMLLTKKDWVGLRPFYSEFIKSEPYRRQVYHNATKDGDQTNGFVELTFTEMGASTKVAYANFLIFRFAATEKTYVGADGSAITRQDLQNEKAAQQMIELYLRPLKEYAEKKSGGAMAAAGGQR